MLCGFSEVIICRPSFFQSNVSWRRLVSMTDSRCVMRRRSLWATPAHCSQWWSCAFTPPPVTFPCAMLDVSHMCTGVMWHSQASSKFPESVWDLKDANGNHLHPLLQPSAARGGFSGRLILKRSQICESDVIYYLRTSRLVRPELTRFIHKTT